MMRKQGHRDLMQRVVNGIRELHKLLRVSKDLKNQMLTSLHMMLHTMQDFPLKKNMNCLDC